MLPTNPSALSYNRSLPTSRSIPGTATTPWPEPGKAAATVTSGPISYYLYRKRGSDVLERIRLGSHSKLAL